MSTVYTYDALGRLNGGTVCETAYCSQGQQTYSFSNTWSGAQLTSAADSVFEAGWTFGYDEFNRLTSRTVNAGSGSFTYVYDRYGNRWQQNALQSGPSPQFSFNTATNQIGAGGYTYDAPGNMTNDGFHTYKYDAEGNIISVDSGSTAQYVYNALNQRVRSVVGSTATEYLFNASGQRVSEWNGTTQAQLKGKYYWGATPVAYYAGGAAHFEHQDWLGTERMRTTYSGAIEGSFTSLPFGDAEAANGTDGDANHYATLDYDNETNTDHAQFRQYNSAEGRWHSPDPYYGSYDPSNPQSFNRYAYVVNNPLSYVDPLGFDSCMDVWVSNWVIIPMYGDGPDKSVDEGSWVLNCSNSVGGGGGGSTATNKSAPQTPEQKEAQCAGITSAVKDLNLAGGGMIVTGGGFGIAALVTAEAPPVSAGFALIGAVDALAGGVVQLAGAGLDAYGNHIVGCK
jgi:RHS repeat-associated protein